ncbi:MAG: transporter substrate-binding domain-containing protein, partial [Gammaproteobacteria bacterium]|nr:transporter substrate-binding domain-containing protein [Gammaproteobacteria bacterium]
MIYKDFSIYLLAALSIFCTDTGSAASRQSEILDDIVSNHQNNPSIIAAVAPSFPPFYYTDQEGLPYGMAIEVMNEIDHHAGYFTKFIVKKSWADVFKSIESGEADIIPNLGITEARKKLYFFTKPYIETKINVFTKVGKQFGKITRLADKRIGVVKSNVGSKIAAQLKFKKVHSFDSLELAYAALSNNKIDAIIYPRLIAIKAAKSSGFSDIIYDTKITLKTIQRAIAISKRHPEIYKKLDTALTSYMQTQEFQDTFTAWNGKPPEIFTISELVIFDLLILFLAITFFIYLW